MKVTMELVIRDENGNIRKEKQCVANGHRDSKSTFQIEGAVETFIDTNYYLRLRQIC